MTTVEERGKPETKGGGGGGVEFYLTNFTHC